ncbi:MAG: hypothetical protein M3203_05765 [Actinomycetota bacterium]|nr:hypothetical protein [Actinomycetota bacterium]
MPETVVVEAKMARWQCASFGPKRLKVMVPVGSKPFTSVAVSHMSPPTWTAGDAWVEMAVATRSTVTRSVPVVAAMTVRGPASALPSTSAVVAV